MRPFAGLLPFDDALRTVLEAARPIDRVETVAIDEADGRIAADPIVAPIDVPPFDRAAMDGYAVIAADTSGASADHPRALRVVDRLFTGEAARVALQSGDCIEIATGAPMPAGATAVVMVEQTRRDGETVRFFAAAAAGQNIGRRGADMARGREAIAAGDVLTPSRIGAIAGVGLAQVRVFERPSVAILSTGNEVTLPGAALEPGRIYDINQFTIASIVRRHGGLPSRLPVTTDTMDDLERALRAAATYDIAVFSGGTSVGDRDLMVDALRAHGEVMFHGIAVKPGKPTLFGRIGRTLIVGMPGYPASCLLNAYTLLLPLLRKTARLGAWRPETRVASLARRIASTPDRHQFYTVRLIDGRAEPAFKASGDITSMAGADGYVEVPVGIDSVDAGSLVTVTLF